MEGMAISLNPSLDLISAAIPCATSDYCHPPCRGILAHLCPVCDRHVCLHLGLAVTQR
jgi:hypothetical protein